MVDVLSKCAGCKSFLQTEREIPSGHDEKVFSLIDNITSLEFCQPMSFPIRSPSQWLPGQPLGTFCLWSILKVAARLRRFAAPADREKRNRRSSDARCAYVFCTMLREMTSQCRGPNSLRPPRATRRPGWARCIAPLSCVVSICDLYSLQQSHAHNSDALENHPPFQSRNSFCLLYVHTLYCI